MIYCNQCVLEKLQCSIWYYGLIRQVENNNNKDEKMTKISKIYYTKSAPVLSFEIFPPKKETGIELLYRTLDEVNPQKLGVDYISVTYGAGGLGDNTKTCDLAQYIQTHLGVTALHHLTGVNQTPESLRDILSKVEQANIENILALRGDLGDKTYVNVNYPYAKDLIYGIKQLRDFNVGAAIYPEGYTGNPITGISIAGTKEKIASGADFLISQFFFDNDMYYNMQERLKNNYIKVPVSAGVMPIISKTQIERVTHMIGSPLPTELVNIVHKYEDNSEDLKKAGIEYALKQIQELLDHGVDGIHLYAMNQPSVLKSMLPIISQEIKTKHFFENNISDHG